MLFIDEYDVPIQAAYVNNYYNSYYVKYFNAFCYILHT